jgi:cytochrome b involved in lipid metabolism
MTTSPLIQFKNQEEIADYAAKHNKVLLVYNDYILDATTFAAHHPGGAGLILNYQSKDVTEQMKSHHPLTLRMADSIVIGSFKKDLTKYINPDRPLMEQIWSMDHETYLHVVESPHWLFVPSPPMFEFKWF